jgi:hypothetical protein
MEALKQTPEGRGILSLLPAAPVEKETLAPKGDK